MKPWRVHGRFVLGAALACCAGLGQAAPTTTVSPRDLAWLDRLTWGVAAEDVGALSELGREGWLRAQLRAPSDDDLPAPIQARITASYGDRAPLAAVIVDLEARRAADQAAAAGDPVKAQAAQQAYGAALNELYRRAEDRSILRDLYARDQLSEQMIWFWFNHFNVHAAKANLRAMVGDYVDTAIRPHALGRFRDLLEATLRHPAMLRYLDNADNAVGHINENYAREIMELHTLGVGAGYTQKDVQELARILTGVGIDPRPVDPHVPPALRGELIRAGLFEFNPNRHDYGDKLFLGHVIRGAGFSEVEEALDILARHPATATHVCRELALYFVSDDPPDALVRDMARAFQHSDGDIATVLRVMIASPQFEASLGRKFKDPAHYVLSAVRAAYGERPVLNTGPIQQWLGGLGEGLYNHETPDGYPMTAAAWSGPGQMEARFELARRIGAGAAGLFRSEIPGATDQPAFPRLQNALYYEGLGATLSPSTLTALDQAVSPQEWNTFFLSSPDFMRR